MEIIKGYKAFHRDADGKLFTRPDSSKERNYFEVGNTYTISNNENIELCENGFHFCKKLNHIFDFYLFSPSIAYCEVEGLFENDLRDIDEDDKKTCTRSIKIIKELTFDEVKNILHSELDKKGEAVCSTEYFQNSDAIDYTEYIINSKAIKNSVIVEGSSAVIKSQAINESVAIKGCYNLYDCAAVLDSNSIIHAQIINDSFLVCNSKVINSSKFILSSENIFYSREVIKSENVSYSSYIKKSKIILDSKYIRDSLLINYSHYIVECRNLSNCLFCYYLNNKEDYVFNKEVSKLRLEKIRTELKCILLNNKWDLKFTNYRQLRDNYREENATLYDFVEYANEEHFENFPEEAIKYLKSLPEFDAKIFKAITNIDMENK